MFPRTFKRVDLDNQMISHEYNDPHTHGILCVDEVQACGQTTCDKITDGESVSDTDPPPY